MKFIKSAFLMLGLVPFFSISWVGDGYAAANCSKATSPGEFCKTAGVKYSCRSGCYCTGGTKTAVGTLNVEAACQNKTSGSSLNNAGIYHCPSAFPSSASGASSATQCYDSNGLYYRVAHCDKGKYFLKNSQNSCQECLDGYYCPGGDWYPSSSDQGLKTCEAGKVPNEAKDGCIDKPIDTTKCIAGTYLPKNSNECDECPDGYVCKAGEYTKQPKDQGKERCTGNTVPNEEKTECVSCTGSKKANADHTKCEEAEIIAEPGEYLPANREKAVPCVGTKKFCPGGYFMKSANEQGRYDCPFNANPTEDKSGCKLELSKKQMEEGISGNGKCWQKTDPDDFKFCVYGVRFQSDVVERKNQAEELKSAVQSIDGLPKNFGITQQPLKVNTMAMKEKE